MSRCMWQAGSSVRAHTVSFGGSGWEPKSVASYQLTVPSAEVTQKAMLVCPRWVWVFLCHTASPGTNLSQRTPVLLHNTHEHKPGRKGSLFSHPGGLEQGVPNLSLSFSSAHWMMQASQDGEAVTDSQQTENGLFSAHSNRQQLAERKYGFWCCSAPQTAANGGASRPAVH